MNSVRSGLSYEVAAIAGGATLLLLSSLVADARDLNVLSRLLEPAYTSMTYANLCSLDRNWEASQPQGPGGVAINYAEHIKDEVIASLTREEAVSVLTQAANSARDEARRQVKKHIVLGDKQAEADRFQRWCDSYVTDFIRSVMRTHDGNHEYFIGRIELGKL
jgi:hypothetical protein